MTASEFLEQHFYNEDGNEIDIKDQDKSLPPAALYKGSNFIYNGKQYHVISVEFKKDAEGKDKSVKIVVKVF